MSDTMEGNNYKIPDVPQKQPADSITISFK